jgi:TolB-like protein/Tfp pilus assembly protein PilF/predicted Ser/Thr protein kinase
MIGKTISHYRIVEKLGEGGMGIVYKAHDTSLDRDVALKFLPQYLTSDTSEKERFYHEARAASALNHPNITTIYEIGEHEGQLFIAMECVEGRTLKQLVESEPPSIKKALEITIQAGEGLAAAHEKGVVHRDIKSENVMLTPKGQAKIMDFGLAKVKGATKLTKAGSTLGTAAYMSPEQAEGEEVDHRSDIFSFGVVLYELLTGKLPFKGEHHAALLYSIINDDPPPLARFNEKASEDLQRIVSKALAKDRGERYQHVDDMLADLRRERRALDYAKTAHARSAAMQPPAPGGAQLQAPAGVPRAPAAAPPPPAAGALQPSAEAPSRAAEAARPAAAKRRGNLLRILVPTIIVAAVVILVILLNPFNFQIGLKKTAAEDRKSVAVLPFTNMSGSKEDEFFSDGITEDIITQLTNIGELKVISRTSVMQYKNTNKNLREIARELGVATVLEGSVRRAGNQVRIVAQLIDATNDEHLWAQTYDKEMTQIFAIQSDVARQIASALKAKLSPREEELLEKKPTDNLDAYSYYLKGREYYYRYTKRDNENAVELFKKALELDPNYALAYAGLGDAYGQGVEKWGFADAWVDSAIAVSNKAIAIDPHLAEGYKALGLAYGAKGWGRKALEADEKAVEINPNYHPALGNIGYQNMGLGRYDEALKWMKKSLAANPMIPYSYVGVGMAYVALADYPRAIEWYNKALDLQPDLIDALFGLGLVAMAQGEYQQCLEQARKISSLQPDNVIGLGMAGNAEVLLGNYEEAENYFNKAMAIDTMSECTSLGYVYWKTGRKEEARRMFERSRAIDEKLIENGKEYYGPRYDMAEIEAVLGNKEEAYNWLQKAVDAGWLAYRPMELDPLLENLRGDDRFKRMMADLKTRVDEMRKRAEEMERE